MSPKATAELEKKAATKKAAASKKSAPKKSTAKKSTARKAVQTDTNEPKAAKAAAKKTAARKTVKKAAAPVSQADQTVKEMETRMDAIAAEEKDGAKISAAIETMTAAPGQTKPALDPVATLETPKEEKPAKAAAKKAPAAKAAAAKEEILESSDQSRKVLDARLDTIAAEAEAGAKIYKAIEEMAAERKEPISPEMASRIELAEKSAAENNVQKNLSARSEAAARLAAKGYKKPARKAAKKASKAKSAQEQIADDIMAEAKDGSRIYRLIAEVPGTPYQDVVKAVEEKAAMESRKELASKTRTAIGAPKEAAPTAEEKAAFYSALDDQTLLEMAQALGLDMDLDTLKKELELSLNVDEQTEKYLKEVEKTAKDFKFEVDGFDASVIPFLTKRVAATLPNKAADNIALAKKINKDIDRMLINDSANDTAIYNDLFDDVRHILMYAQENNLDSLEEVERAIPTDLKKLVDRFMTVAYTILPGWQYNDVKYYEGFLYGVMAQFEDLADQQNRALMDIADLYIKHGDYQRGNDGYGYVLRENQLKDQIYYRFAKVYEPFDLQRAKGIASEALRIVDGRYTYYPMILEILQK